MNFTQMDCNEGSSKHCRRIRCGVVEKLLCDKSSSLRRNLMKLAGNNGNWLLEMSRFCRQERLPILMGSCFSWLLDTLKICNFPRLSIWEGSLWSWLLLKSKTDKLSHRGGSSKIWGKLENWFPFRIKSVRGMQLKASGSSCKKLSVKSRCCRYFNEGILESNFLMWQPIIFKLTRENGKPFKTG